MRRRLPSGAGQLWEGNFWDHNLGKVDLMFRWPRLVEVLGLGASSSARCP